MASLASPFVLVAHSLAGLLETGQSLSWVVPSPPSQLTANHVCECRAPVVVV